jgi:hypothetical protein
MMQKISQSIRTPNTYKKEENNQRNVEDEPRREVSNVKVSNLNNQITKADIKSVPTYP